MNSLDFLVLFVVAQIVVTVSGRGWNPNYSIKEPKTLFKLLRPVYYGFRTSGFHACTSFELHGLGLSGSGFVS